MKTLVISALLSGLVATTIASAANIDPTHTHGRSVTPRGILNATGTTRMAGLDGSYRATVDLADGRFETRVNLGAYRLADVYDGTTRWRVDASGGFHQLNSDFARTTARTEAWVARFGWLAPVRGGATISAPRQQIDSGRTLLFRVASPRGGGPVSLWTDPTTGDVARIDYSTWLGIRTTRYSDYRFVSGRRLPFAIHVSDSNGEQSIRIERYDVGAGGSRPTFAPPHPPDDMTIPEQGTTVPIAVFPQLVLEASVNGRPPMSFLLDSGAYSILTPTAADALGLKSVGESQTRGTGAGTLTQRETRVKTLQIGDAVVHDLHFSVLPLSYANMEQGPKPPLVGLLGLEILERFVVRIDYRSGKLTLLPSNAAVGCGGVWQPARFTDDMPTVDATLDGVPGAFTIDTGNNGPLTVYDHWVHARGTAARYRSGVETVSYGAAGSSKSWVSYGKTFRMGLATIARPMLRTTDDTSGVATSISEAGNLGTALLANYILTFDYARSRVCFEYVPGYVPIPFNRAGLRAIKDDPASFIVTLVNPGSPAAIAGLRKDDRILSIDGRPASELGGGDLTRTITGPQGTEVDIEYRRGSSEFRTHLSLREMLH